MSVEGRAFLKLLRDTATASLISVPNLPAAWDSAGEWSKFMLGSRETRAAGDFGVIGRLGQALGYSLQAEYFRIDQIWYSSPPTASEDWLIDAFIEHENNPRRVPETFRKLLQLGPGLKVMITYPSEDSATMFVDSVTGLIQKRFGTAPDARILLIFGFLRSNSVDWQGHEFDGLGRLSPLT